VCGARVQPMCDGSHKAINSQSAAPAAAAEAGSLDKSVVFRSVKFSVDDQKQYALCNCKQTATPPFCDGTHKQHWIQQAAASHTLN